MSAQVDRFVHERLPAPADQANLKGPLLEAMETASIRPFEHAPLFDRAVHSLMAGANSLSV